METNDKPSPNRIHNGHVFVFLLYRLFALAVSVIAISIMILLLTRVFDFFVGSPPTYFEESNLTIVWIIEGLLILLVNTLDALSYKAERGLTITTLTHDEELGVELDKKKTFLPYFVDGCRLDLLPWYVTLVMLWPLSFWVPSESIREEIEHCTASIRLELKKRKSKKI